MSDSCSCIYLDDNYDAIRLYREIKRTAKKRHTCGECRANIHPGDKYTCCSGICIGKYITHRVCLDCYSVVESYFCEGFVWEKVWEYFEEHVRCCYGDVKVVANLLTPHALDKVCDIIQEYWDDHKEEME